MTSNTLELIAGRTWSITWTITDDSGTPIDLTGVRLDWRMRDGCDSAIAASASTETGEIDVSDPTTGVAEITIAADITAAVAAPRHYICSMTGTHPDASVIPYGHCRVEVGCNI